jgi:ABC-type Fe3+/spermidine/putrescine transport system ATPase subunit
MTTIQRQRGGAGNRGREPRRSLRRGDRGRPGQLHREPGEQLTLLGPSGCGKTTTLRAIAGLERPAAGAIRIGGETMYDEANGIHVPASGAGLSMVFQSYAIWPHMSVFDNVAYGLRVRKNSAAEIDEKVRHALDLVKMGAYAQPQRLAALGRPAAARGCRARLRVLAESAAVRRAAVESSTPSCARKCGSSCASCSTGWVSRPVYVTHDLEEALAMSDRIIVMRGGHIEQAGPAADIYNYPRTAFVADFVGSANLITGRLRPDLARDGMVRPRRPTAATSCMATRTGARPGPEPTMSVRTVHLQLSQSNERRRRARSMSGPSSSSATSFWVT